MDKITIRYQIDFCDVVKVLKLEGRLKTLWRKLAFNYFERLIKSNAMFGEHMHKCMVINLQLF